MGWGDWSPLAPKLFFLANDHNAAFRNRKALPILREVNEPLDVGSKAQHSLCADTVRGKEVAYTPTPVNWMPGEQRQNRRPETNRIES